jgi:hypothetical protein
MILHIGSWCPALRAVVDKALLTTNMLFFSPAKDL